jgi:hypothetical protein
LSLSESLRPSRLSSPRALTSSPQSLLSYYPTLASASSFSLSLVSQILMLPLTPSVASISRQAPAPRSLPHCTSHSRLLLYRQVHPRRSTRADSRSLDVRPPSPSTIPSLMFASQCTRSDRSRRDAGRLAQEVHVSLYLDPNRRFCLDCEDEDHPG